MVWFVSGFVELGWTPVQHSAFPCPLKSESRSIQFPYTTNNISTFSFSQKSFRSGGLHGDEPRTDW